MRNGEAIETAESLLSGAQAAGFRVTRAQLHRWQQAGLLPKPRQRGRGRGRGTEVLYPPGSGDQLIALCGELKKKRRLSAACWGLWWNGYAVSEVSVRDVFEKQLAYAEAIRIKVSGLNNGEEFDEKRDLVTGFEKAAEVRLSDSAVARFRRRTGRRNFPTLLNFLFSATAGIPPKLDDDDAEIVAKVFKLANPSGVEDLLGNVAEALDPRKLRETFEGASFETLAEARDEVRTILDLLATTNLLVAIAMGGGIAEAIVASLQQPSERDGPHVVLLWLSERRSQEVRRAYDDFVSVCRDITRGILSPNDTWTMLESNDQVPEEPSNG